MCSADIFLGLLAILFPPLPVWVKRGVCSADSLINILLCILGFIPGLLHAWYIIARYPENEHDYDRAYAHDSERVTYVFVQGGQNSQPRQQQRPKPSNGNERMTYGTTSAGGSSSQQPAALPQQQGVSNGGEGGSDGAPPPSYAQVVAGDNKVQTHD